MDDAVLKDWLAEYSLGDLFESGELELGLEKLDKPERVAESRVKYKGRK